MGTGWSGTCGGLIRAMGSTSTSRFFEQPLEELLRERYRTATLPGFTLPWRSARNASMCSLPSLVATVGIPVRSKIGDELAGGLQVAPYRGERLRASSDLAHEGRRSSRPRSSMAGTAGAS